jgi:hypothetical protein
MLQTLFHWSEFIPSLETVSACGNYIIAEQFDLVEIVSIRSSKEDYS